MRRCLTLISVLIGLALWVPPAWAASGNGLYQPFPGKASTARAKRYLKRLPPGVPAGLRRLSERQLERGVFVGRARDPSIRQASVRGGVARDPSGALPWPWQLALVLLPLATGVFLVGRRRGPSVTTARPRG